MTIRFDSLRLAQDFDTRRKIRRISLNRACVRADIQSSTVAGILSGNIKDITANTAVRMMTFMGITDITKYIIETDN